MRIYYVQGVRLSALCVITLNFHNNPMKQLNCAEEKTGLERAHSQLVT